MSPAGPRHRHGPLFWRIYLHGVLMLVVVGVAVGGGGVDRKRTRLNSSH